MLLPAFLAATAETGLPLDLIELGPSAGLNLLVDRYRYRYAERPVRPRDALLELTARGDAAGRSRRRCSSGELVVRRRRGIDLAPIDATTADGYLLLRSFVWPGPRRARRPPRRRRRDAAPEPERPELIRGDYVELLPGLLADRPGDALTVVFQTVSTVYLPETAARALGDALEAAGADGRPLAWVSVRRWDLGAGKDAVFELELRVWPGAARVAAHVDPHGNSLDWRLPDS